MSRVIRPATSLTPTGSGSAGAAPPSNAPYEVSQPLTDDAFSAINPETGQRESAADRAARNSRSLKPLPWETGAAPASPPALARAASSFPAPAEPSAAPAPPEPPRGVAGAETEPPPPRPVMTTVARPPVAEADQPPPPAWDADSIPAEFSSHRGVPRPIADPHKQITGGFGRGEARYFPLDGLELKELVRELLDRMNARLDRDLRFSIAVTYPRVTARVIIEVQGFAQAEPDVLIEQFEKGPVPLKTARAVADEICFVVIEQASEVDETGQPIIAHDTIRDELGLTRPEKQKVSGDPLGQMVDVL
jgi:hypothetical protein